MTNFSRRHFIASATTAGALTLSGGLLAPQAAFAASRGIKGKLAGPNGRSFPFTYTAAGADSATVIYVGGMGGRGDEVSKKAKDFMAAGLNLLTFDRAEPGCRGTEDCVEKVRARVPGGNVMASPDGSPAAADDILKNELGAILSYAISAPNYNAAKGIVLIGGSYGSFLTLLATTSRYAKHIKKAVFLSPAIAPQWMEGNHAPPENVARFRKLVSAFGTRSALAIGGKKDLFWQDVSTLTAAKFLHDKLKSHPQVIETNSRKHAAKLLLGDRKVRGQMISWIAASA